MKGTCRNLSILTLLLFAAFQSTTVLASQLSFEDRVRAQEAIERVYYAHQLETTKSFEEAVPLAVIEEKVRTYLRKSVALEKVWDVKITGEMLRAEVERMAGSTRMPERLREIFASLDDDPMLVEECLARPILVNRLLRQSFDSDRSLHTGTQREPEEVGRQPRSEGPTFEEWYESVKDRLDPDRVTVVGAGSASLPDPEVESVSVSSGCSQDNTWDRGANGGVPASGPFQTAVWTGNLMILWPGGSRGDNGGSRYDPITDSSTPNSALNAPDYRGGHTAIWTGTTMIVWGGFDQVHPGFLNTGGRYDPLTDAWLPTSTVNAPPMSNHSAVWTGNRMIVYGGLRLYQPTPGVPAYVVSQDTGGSYDPLGDTWTYIPSAGLYNYWGMAYHAAVWTGTRMIVWGGQCSSYPNYNPGCYTFPGPNYVGSQYDPVAQTWTPVSLLNSPGARAYNRAVWTGSLMLVWGALGSGSGRYDPASDSWTSMSTVNAPANGEAASAVWTGSSMIVWGGRISSTTCLNTGGRYDPVADRWGLTSLVNAPSARKGHLAVWTGSSMIIGGGEESGGAWNYDGARYLVDPNNPDADGDDFPLCAGDCDDTNPAVYPGAPQICDGINDDCSDPAWPALSIPEDVDADGFLACADDCNDADPNVHPGATERCNAIDDDCDGTVDGFPTSCGVGGCSSIGTCMMGVDNCTPGPPSPEACNGIDDDCDGIVDTDISPGAPGDSDGDAVCAATDSCPLVYNPSQQDLDGDGAGDACDLTVIEPPAGGSVDCRQGAQPPTIAWLPYVYDRFRVSISTDPNVLSFLTRRSVRGTSVQPRARTWRDLCDAGGDTFYIRVAGEDMDVPHQDPGRVALSEAVSVQVLR